MHTRAQLRVAFTLTTILMSVALRFLARSHITHLSAICIIFEENCPPAEVEVRGSVASGYEPARDALARLVTKGYTHGASLVVYSQGKQVASLAVGNATLLLDGTTEPLTHSHIVNVFSAGKVLEALAIAYLVQHKRLAYTDRLAQHWPEFANGGKEDLTLSDLLRHDSNLAWFNDTIAAALEDLGTPAFATRLADMQHNNVGGGARRDYHALLRGLLLNQVAQRVDAQNRTLGQIIEQELATPLGVSADELVAAGLHDGPSDPRWARVAQMQTMTLLRAALIPMLVGPLGLTRPLGGLTSWIMPGTLDPTSPISLSTTSSLALGDLFAPPNENRMNSEAFIRAELTSGGVLTSARALGRLLGMVANGGELDGTRVLNAACVDAILANATGASLASAYMRNSEFTQGGVGHMTRTGLEADGARFLTLEPQDDFYGWYGASGSQAFFSRKHNWAFAFVTTSMFTIDLYDVQEMSEIVNTVAARGRTAAEAAKRREALRDAAEREAAEQQAIAEERAKAKAAADTQAKKEGERKAAQLLAQERAEAERLSMEAAARARAEKDAAKQDAAEHARATRDSEEQTRRILAQQRKEQEKLDADMPAQQASEHAAAKKAEKEAKETAKRAQEEKELRAAKKVAQEKAAAEGKAAGAGRA